MKKLLAMILAGVMTMSLAACGGSDDAAAGNQDNSQAAGGAEGEPQTITVTVTDAEGNPTDVEFPANAERIVVLNWQTLDFLDAVGMGDKVVGMMKGGTYPAHLEKYELDENIQSVGTGLKDPDMEAIMSLEPDIIFISDRIEDQIDQFQAIAPTMAAYVDYDMGFMEGYKSLASKHSQIFGIEGEVDEIIAGYDERIAAIAEVAGEQTALLGIFAGGLNTLGDVGRASIVVNEMGFTNLAGGENVNHGNISSYEAWLELDPDWMFVLDKDTAVGNDAVAAKEQMEVNNPVIAETSAYKNGQIVYLAPSTVWYVADGGITSLDLMITNIEEGVGIK